MKIARLAKEEEVSFCYKPSAVVLFCARKKRRASLKSFTLLFEDSRFLLGVK